MIDPRKESAWGNAGLESVGAQGGLLNAAVTGTPREPRSSAKD